MAEATARRMERRVAIAGTWGQVVHLVGMAASVQAAAAPTRSDSERLDERRDDAQEPRPA